MPFFLAYLPLLHARTDYKIIYVGEHDKTAELFIILPDYYCQTDKELEINKNWKVTFKNYFTQWYDFNHSLLTFNNQKFSTTSFYRLGRECKVTQTIYLSPLKYPVDDQMIRLYKETKYLFLDTLTNPKVSYSDAPKTYFYVIRTFPPAGIDVNSNQEIYCPGDKAVLTAVSSSPITPPNVNEFRWSKIPSSSKIMPEIIDCNQEIGIINDDRVLVPESRLCKIKSSAEFTISNNMDSQKISVIFDSIKGKSEAKMAGLDLKILREFDKNNVILSITEKTNIAIRNGRYDVDVASPNFISCGLTPELYSYLKSLKEITNFSAVIEVPKTEVISTIIYDQTSFKSKMLIEKSDETSVFTCKVKVSFQPKGACGSEESMLKKVIAENSIIVQPLCKYYFTLRGNQL